MYVCNYVCFYIVCHFIQPHGCKTNKKNRKIWLIYSQRDATRMSLHVHSETVKQLLHIDKKSEEAK